MKTTKAKSSKPKTKQRAPRCSRKLKCEPKGLAINEQLESMTEFLELNDYCIDEICEWLPLSTLASLGMTCNRLNHVCSSYFRRKHPANHVVISSSKGKVSLSPDQPYVHCFSEQFKSIIIYGADRNLFQFVATKFKEKPLKKISFFAADDLTENHAVDIDGIINGAEIIEFIRCSTVASISDILKYCSNMKFLVLKSFTECKMHGHTNGWLLQRYPQLVHLHWDLPKTVPSELSTFFRQNSNVTSVYGTEQLLPFIRNYDIKLKVFVLKFDEMTRDKFERLREMCEQKTIETLYLMGSFRGLMNISITLNNVEGISCSRITSTTIAELFPSLKLLKMDITSMKQAKQLAEQLLHLEEAYIDVNQVDYIVPFVRYAKKLKKIYINNTTAMKPGTKLRLQHLNKQRKKLGTPTKLTIYLKEETYLSIKCMSNCSELAFIQINPIETHVTNNVFVNTFLDN